MKSNLKPWPKPLTPRLFLIGMIAFLCIVGIRYCSPSPADEYGFYPPEFRGEDASPTEAGERGVADSRAVEETASTRNIERLPFEDREASGEHGDSPPPVADGAKRGFRFRATDASGEPMDSGGVLVLQGEDRIAGGPLGGDGVFNDDRATLGSGRVEIRLVAGAGRFVALIEAPPPRPAQGVTDFGDVKLLPDGGRAAGFVYDPSGRPTRFAAIKVVAASFGDAPEPKPEFAGGVDVNGPLADGSFIIYAAADLVAVDLSALSDRRMQGPIIRVRAGERGVRLEVGRAHGSIAGAILCDGPVPTDIVVEVASQSPGSASVTLTTDIKPDGSFTFESIPEGTATVRILFGAASSEGAQEALKVIEDIAVFAGERAHDPRLLPVDLRGAIVSATVRAAGPDGLPIDEFFVVVRGKKCVPDSGAVRVSGRSFPIEVWIQPTGGALRRTRAEISGDTIVSLKSRMKVWLKIDPAVATEAESLGLVPRLSARRDPRERTAPPAAISFKSHDENGVPLLDEPGEYGVFWFPRMGEMTPDGRAIPPGASAGVMVQDVEGVQVFFVTPGPSDLAAARAYRDRLGRRDGPERPTSR